MIPRSCPVSTTLLGVVAFFWLAASPLLFPHPLYAQAAVAPRATATAAELLSASPSPLLFSTASADNTPLDFLAETATSSTVTSALSFDIFSSTLKMVTSLAIVIGLVMALSWFLQQRGGLNRSIFGRTLGILPLDNRRFLYLVDVMGRVLVLGVTEHSINLLCELTDKASIDALRVQSKAPAGSGLERIFSFLRHGRPLTEEDQVEEANAEQTMNFSARTLSAQQQVQQMEKLFLKRQSAEVPGNSAGFPPPSQPAPRDDLPQPRPDAPSPPRPRNQL